MRQQYLFPERFIKWIYLLALYGMISLYIFLSFDQISSQFYPNCKNDLIRYYWSFSSILLRMLNLISKVKISFFETIHLYFIKIKCQKKLSLTIWISFLKGFRGIFTYKISIYLLKKNYAVFSVIIVTFNFF